MVLLVHLKTTFVDETMVAVEIDLE
jgi:hypothetical protein